MEVMSSISQLADAGIVDLATIVIVVLVVRYSSSETRREVSKEINEKITSAKTDLQQSYRQETEALRTHLEKSIHENRQEINAVRTYSEQSHKEIMLHLIDVRERLANMEGRLGVATPRMSAVSPPLESPTEAPQS